jgi:hypothetical protein
VVLGIRAAAIGFGLSLPGVLQSRAARLRIVEEVRKDDGN